MNRPVYDISKDNYFLCLHVRPATCFIGLLHFVYAFLNMMHYGSNYNEILTRKDDVNLYHQTKLENNRILVLNITAEFLKILISLLLLHGVLKSKASYLIPFFLMLMFHFFNSVSLFLEVNAKNINKKETPFLLNDFLAILYKFCLICCVWKCYRYLKLKETTLPLHHTFRPNQSSNNTSNNISVLQVEPPNYDDCITVTKTEASPEYEDPPDYATACQQNEKKV